MPQTTAIVGNVRAIEPGGSVRPDIAPAGAEPEQTWVARFGPQGDAYGLSSDVDFRETLEVLRDIGRPAYVTRADSGRITGVMIPLVGRVDRLQADEAGNLHVGLDRSAKHLVLTAGAEDHERIASLLQRSLNEGLLLAVTDMPDDERIIDANEVPGLAQDWAAAMDFGPFGATPSPPAVSIATLDEADDLFDHVSRLACDLPIPVRGCIPFAYPDDGCFARAHRMVELLQTRNVRAGKVWAYGSLSVDTANHPNCRVRWEWHVAPFLRVSGGSGRRVLDPSLFDRAVPLTRWIGALGDPDPLVQFSSGSVYLRKKTGQFREESKAPRRESIDDLTKYRQRLKRRQPPPPYASCRI